MSEKHSAVAYANAAAAILAGGATMTAGVIDLGLGIETDVPVLKQLNNHAGNIIIGCLLALGVARGVRTAEEKTGGFTATKRLLSTGAISLALGAGLNAIPDTQAGMDHIGKHIYDCQNSDPKQDGRYCTVDSGDYIWGTGAAGVIALALTEWRRREDQEDAQPPAQGSAGTGEPPEPS